VVAWGALPRTAGHPWLTLAAFAVVFVLGCWVADRAQAVLGKHDSPHIVLDEVMGMVATMFLNPLDWIHLLIGFALFRLFDIVKPPPASIFDRMRGGAGVMLDDLAAAVYANIALRVVTRLIV
jgi:phosphatidylglycerophosphatase A